MPELGQWWQEISSLKGHMPRIPAWSNHICRILRQSRALSTHSSLVKKLSTWEKCSGNAWLLTLLWQASLGACGGGWAGIQSWDLGEASLKRQPQKEPRSSRTAQENSLFKVSPCFPLSLGGVAPGSCQARGGPFPDADWRQDRRAMVSQWQFCCFQRNQLGFENFHCTSEISLLSHFLSLKFPLE